MPKKVIDEQEWYPVLCLEDKQGPFDLGVEIDIPPDLFERYQRINAEFTAIQLELRKLSREAERERRQADADKK